MPDFVFAWLCVPLAVYILLSGLDDFWVDLQWFRRKLGRRGSAGFRTGSALEGPIAVWVACWQESDVLERMLEHNRSAIADDDYCFFIGVYPNDKATVAAANRAAKADHRVLVAEVPHDGPTSKADCLNWIYQRMLVSEEETGRRYRLVVIHDAEDLIHPRSFAMIRRAAGTGYDMVQVPVLALPTPVWELTHGLYCDDFAESQTKDLATRVDLGGFLPGCGVGTGFRREALDALAAADSNRLFDPGSLTEDYDNGLRLFRNGSRQVFLDLCWDGRTPVATREYFPRTLMAAVRQRSRWITGNSLQAWERFGWGKGLSRRWVQAYFFWRDRKGLWGAPLGLAANLLVAAGVLVGLPVDNMRSWEEVKSFPLFEPLLWINSALLAERTAVRIWTVSRIYGWGFALLAPLRTAWGNCVNTAACALALRAWARWRFQRIPLRWVKTEHAYPNREALAPHRRRLGEILVANGYCPAGIVEHALAHAGEERLGEYLLEHGLISEEDWCEALGLQQALPVARLDRASLRADLTRCLPERLQREHSLVVLEAREGELHVAAAKPPTEALMEEVRRYTRLAVRFWLAPAGDILRARATLQSRS